MQAQRRTLMFLLALTALAAAALALLTCTARRQEAAGREEEAGAIPLSAFAAKELTALTYTRAGQTVSLLYDGGAWAVAGDPDAPLEEEAVQAILTALGGYVTGQTTPAMGADPAACAGCDPVVTVTAADGEKEYALTYAAAADGCRLTVEGDRSVYTVDAAALAAFRPAGQLRAGR